MKRQRARTTDPSWPNMWVQTQSLFAYSALGGKLSWCIRFISAINSGPNRGRSSDNATCSYAYAPKFTATPFPQWIYIVPVVLLMVLFGGGQEGGRWVCWGASVCWGMWEGGILPRKNIWAWKTVVDAWGWKEVKGWCRRIFKCGRLYGYMNELVRMLCM